MRPVFALFLLFVPACSGPEVPSSYLVHSPACADAPPAPRHPVAEVLGPIDPVEVLVPGNSPVVLESSPGSEEHSHHRGHVHGNHGTEKRP